MPGLKPNEQELIKLAHSPNTGPVVMVNLLRFKSGNPRNEQGSAEGGPGVGEEAYVSYLRHAAPMVGAVGGRLLWQGRADEYLMGDTSDRWDRVVLVEYPSRSAFLELVNTPEFQALQGEREAGLEAMALISTTAIQGASAQ